jgi:hypothetical protein
LELASSLFEDSDDEACALEATPSSETADFESTRNSGAGEVV